jgi:acyl dehydratase
MAGYYFEDFKVGEEFTTPTRTLTETDVVMFAAMTGDYNELHTSSEYMKDSQFNQRLVHGLLALSVSHGLLFRLGLLDGTAIAFLGIDSWQFQAPLFFDDTIHVRIKVAEARASQSKPDRGIVKLHLEIVKQDGKIAQSGYKSIMVKRRAAEIS